MDLRRGFGQQVERPLAIIDKKNVVQKPGFAQLDTQKLLVVLVILDNEDTNNRTNGWQHGFHVKSYFFWRPSGLSTSKLQNLRPPPANAMPSPLFFIFQVESIFPLPEFADTFFQTPRQNPHP
jgi:hypothetical protein